MVKTISNVTIFGIGGIVLAWLIGFVVNYVTPFKYNLSFEYVHFNDMCVGETIQEIELVRHIRPVDGYPGKIDSELVIFKDGKWKETDMTRVTNVVYQYESSTTSLLAKWNNPVTEPGKYRANLLITINPYFGIYKTELLDPTLTEFNVIECNHE